MDGRDLSSKLQYIGMEKAVRKLAIDSKLATMEEIAVMSEIEVCDLVMKDYELVYAENEELGLVRKEDMSKYHDIVKIISR